MLRLAAAAIWLANAAFFAWTQGWLGAGAEDDREPARLARQVRPERVVVLPPETPVPAATTTACLEAGPVAEADAEAATQTLAALLPTGAWSEVELPATPVGPAARRYRVENLDPATAARLASIRLDAAGTIAFRACEVPAR